MENDQKTAFEASQNLDSVVQILQTTNNKGHTLKLEHHFGRTNHVVDLDNILEIIRSDSELNCLIDLDHDLTIIFKIEPIPQSKNFGLITGKCSKIADKVFLIRIHPLSLQFSHDLFHELRHIPHLLFELPRIVRAGENTKLILKASFLLSYSITSTAQLGSLLIFAQGLLIVANKFNETPLKTTGLTMAVSSLILANLMPLQRIYIQSVLYHWLYHRLKTERQANRIGRKYKNLKIVSEQ